MRSVKGEFEVTEVKRYGGVGITEWYFPVVPNAVATGDIINTGGTFTITAGFVGFMSDGVAAEAYCGAARIPDKADIDGGWDIYAYVAPATAAQVSVLTVKLGYAKDGEAIAENSYTVTGAIGTAGEVQKVLVATAGAVTAADYTVGGLLTVRLGIDAGATGAILYGVGLEPK